MQSYLVKNLTNISCALVLFGASTPSLIYAKAPEKPKADAKQVSAQFNAMVEKYLMDNPEIIIKAAQKHQANMEATRKKASADYMRKNAKKLFAAALDGLLGSPKASTNMMIFTDYQCGYCKKAAENLEKVMSANSNIKLSIKQLPILGEASVLAAKAAMFANDQGKFAAANKALLAMDKPLSKEKIVESFKKLGIAKEDLDKAWSSEKYETAIKDNYREAQGLGVQGTPVIAIANKNYSKVDFVEEFMDEKLLAKAVNNY